jgi:hypothetical protein
MVKPMRWFVVALFAIACHHDPPPEEPLPVSSTGTPIGFLIDDTQLHLSTDQLGTLRGIDDNLRRQLEDLDKTTKKQVGSGGGGVQQQQPPMQPMGRGRRRMGGMNNGSAQRAPRNNEAAADKLADERNEDVKAALQRAFAVLEPAQRDRAKQVLSDHDVDIDVDDLTPPQPQPPQQLPPPPVAPIEEPPPSPPPVAPIEEPPPSPPPPTIPPPTIPPPSKAGK